MLVHRLTTVLAVQVVLDTRRPPNYYAHKLKRRLPADALVPGQENPRTMTYTAILFPCDTAALSAASEPLANAFGCADSAQTGILDRSKALTLCMSSVPGGVSPIITLPAIFEALHILHGTHLILDANPVAEVVDVFGYTLDKCPLPSADGPQDAAQWAAALDMQAFPASELDEQEMDNGAVLRLIPTARTSWVRHRARVCTALLICIAGVALIIKA